MGQYDNLSGGQLENRIKERKKERGQLYADISYLQNERVRRS